MDIIYLRVSKTDESKQDPEQQLDAIKEKFNLKNPTIYQERGSAYDLKKINKRQDFLKILNICFDADTTTIKDLYLQNTIKKDISIYVWDYARIIRNIELNLLFSLLSSWYGVKVYSYKDKSIFKEVSDENPTAKLTRIMMNTISAFSSEEYSYTISTNVKKSIVKTKTKAFSKGRDGNKGKKWGGQFRTGKMYLDDDGVVRHYYKQISQDKEEKLIKRIKRLNSDYKSNNEYGYYSKIISKISKEYGITLSKSYLSKELK